MSDSWPVRVWEAADADAVGALLDPGASAVWRTQFHTLHGPDPEPPGWGRTLVATMPGDNRSVVGAASIIRNRLHPSHYVGGVEVALGRRRRGLGTALLAGLLRARTDGRPIAAKVSPADGAASAFVRRAGGRIYQRCPGVVVDPRSAEVMAWARGTGSGAGELVELGTFGRERLAEWYAEQYRWVHRAWSPVGDEKLLRDVVAQQLDDLDEQLSTGVRLGSHMAATAYCFRERDGHRVVVAETLSPVQPDGEALVGATIAAVLARAAAGGISEIEFDGHVDDPHLAPVVSSLPAMRLRPLDLIEVS